MVDRLEQTYRTKIDFYVYPTVDSDPDAAEFATDHGVRAVPTMVLVNPDGSERKRWLGAQPENVLVSEFEVVILDGPQPVSR